MAYHVLMYSHRHRTQAFSYEHLHDAAQTLARLAAWAEGQRQRDGERHYFCIAGEDAAETAGAAEMAPAECLPAALLIVFLAQGTAPWVATDRSDIRVLVCDADLPTPDAPAACSRPERRTLADLPWEVRQVIAEHETATTLFVNSAPFDYNDGGDPGATRKEAAR